MQLIAKPVRSTDENICGAAFSYTGTPSGVQVEQASQQLTFAAFEDADYPSSISGVFALGPRVASAMIQIDARVSVSFNVYALAGSSGVDSDNAQVSMVMLAGAQPIFIKSYFLREQDASGALIDTRESGRYSVGGFAITMPTRMGATYSATLSKPGTQGQHIDLSLNVPITGAGSAKATARIDFPLEDKAAGFTTGELQALLPELKQHEGEKDFMYVDSQGHVTTGVGFLLPNEGAAAAYPFVDLDDVPATEQQKREEWRLIASKYDPAHKHGADWYEDYTNLYLQPEFIDQKLRELVDADFHGLSQDFPGFAGFPSAARMALQDMRFNLGASGLVNKFPRLMAAIERRDWRAAAAESHRSSISELRNNYVRDLFLRAAESQ